MSERPRRGRAGDDEDAGAGGPFGDTGEGFEHDQVYQQLDPDQGAAAAEDKDGPAGGMDANDVAAAALGGSSVPPLYEEEFEVEAIVRERVQEGVGKQYLVKWVGYPHDQNTWEPAGHLEGSEEAIRAFKKDQRKQRKADERKKREDKKKERRARKKRKKDSDGEEDDDDDGDDSSDEWQPPSDLEGQISPYKDEYGSSGNERGLRKRGRSDDDWQGAPDVVPVRFGQVIQLKEGCGQKYAQLCRDMQAIPEINQCFRACNIKNFTIFHKAGLLFCFVEYVGTDIATDFNRLATDPQMKYFWDMSREYQEPMYFHEPHEWWSRLDELFHA